MVLVEDDEYSTADTSDTLAKVVHQPASSWVDHGKISHLKWREVSFCRRPNPKSRRTPLHNTTGPEPLSFSWTRRESLITAPGGDDVASL
jgi:hypothetical protein